MSAAAVEVEALERHYGDVRALDGISFSAAPGEVFGLLGPNGAGKSTTIRILTGRTRPSAGSAHVLGHPVPAELERVRSEINLVPETPTVYLRATAKENLDLFCKLYGLPAARGDAALERVGLAEASKRKVKTFSTGMRQRLLLARALLNEPRVLFLDEPTRGLDRSPRATAALVAERAAAGTTIFLSTHDMTEADSLCDRVAFLADGRIAALDAAALKLRLGGAPEVDLVLDDESDLRFSLHREADAARLHELVAAGRVRTVHSREATLADVFIALAGRSLDDGVNGRAEEGER